MWETPVQSLSREDPLEKEVATHSSTLAWKIPWTEEPSTLAWKIPWTEKPGRLQSMGSQRVRHDWATSLHFESRIKVLAPVFWDWLFSSTAYFRGDETDPSLFPPSPPGRKSHRTLASFLHKETEYTVVKMGSGKTIIESSSQGRSVNCNCLQDFGTWAKKMPARMVSRLTGLQSGTGR